MQPNRSYLLPLIVLSQFAGTSLWFAGNAIAGHLVNDVTAISYLTSMVQFGFIAGTFVFSFFRIADMYPSHQVFFLSALIAAFANLLIIPFSSNITLLYSLRLITGFFLAGIYPVGMKIASDHFGSRLGIVLGWLVGALVLGTAFPHFVKSGLQTVNWKMVIYSTSALSIAGGICMLWKAASPGSKTGTSLGFSLNLHHLFRNKHFRGTAFGYFGHMWELYAFWAFIPIILSGYNSFHGYNLPQHFWAFAIIGMGAPGCIIGGWLSRKYGSRNIAFYSLMISGLCCLLSPLVFQLSPIFFLPFLLLWGMTVVSDSPQFSTLVAQNTPAEMKGTALTLVTCIGFAITIFSIQLLGYAFPVVNHYLFLLLAPGPFLGILALKKNLPSGKAGN